MWVLFPSLSDLNGSNGVTLTRSSGSGELGFAVRDAGDVNNDGVSDVIIGIPADNPKGQFEISGRSLVVFGRSSDRAFPSVINTDNITSDTGFFIDGAVGDRAGASVSGAGDVNGDSIDDYLIGAPDNNRAYLVYGPSSNPTQALDLAQLSPSQGVVLQGVTDDFTGSTMRDLGDFNGDGFDDVAIVAPTRWCVSLWGMKGMLMPALLLVDGYM